MTSDKKSEPLSLVNLRNRNAIFALIVALLSASILAVFLILSRQEIDTRSPLQIRHDRIEEINLLLALEDYEQAIQVIDDSIATGGHTDEILAELYVLRSSVYASQPDYEKALEVAYKAESIDSSYNTVSNIASIAILMEDKQLINEWVPRQIELLDKSDDMYEDIKGTLERALKGVN